MGRRPREGSAVECGTFVTTTPLYICLPLSSFLSPFLIFILPPSQISYVETLSEGHFRHLLAIPSREKLLRVIEYLLDEDEFLSPYGIRSLSKVSQSVWHQTYIAPFISDHLQYAK